MSSNNKYTACYLTYYGFSEPLLWSQAIPYLKGISLQTGIKFYIVSFEKPDLINNKGMKKRITEYFSDIDFEWWYLTHHKSTIGKLWDILLANLICLYLVFIKKVGIFHARGTICYMFLIMVNRIKKVKILLDLRGIVEEYVDAGIWKVNSLIHRIVKKIEGEALKHSDAVVVLSHKIKGILIEGKYYSHQLPEEKIKVIYCAVDTERFIPNGSFDLKEKLGLKGKLILLYLGSIGTWYMLDEMLDFFKTLKDKYQNSHFLIITPVEKEKVLKAVKNKHLNHVDFTIKYAAPDDVSDYINISDIGISFIKPCLSKQASFPTKIGEYLSCGLPVIINSGIGDVDDIVMKYQTGFVIKELNYENYIKVCEELNSLLSDKTIKERARKTALEVLSLKHAVEQYVDVYRTKVQKV